VSNRFKDIPSGQYGIRAELFAGGKRLGTKFFYPGTTDRKMQRSLQSATVEHLDGFDIRVTK
jgi:hypothetical protein